MTPEEDAKAQQGFATIAEVYPTHWKRMFDNLMAEGFTEPQAMKILLTYVASFWNTANDR